MKIFVDFDDSLFNTKKFRDQLINIFLQNGVTRKDFFATYYDYPEKTSRGLKKYDPEKQIDILSKKRVLNKKKLKYELRRLIEDSSKFTFDDAKIFLNGFRKNNLFLISFAKTKFQCDKIKYSGLTNYFSKVIVSDRTKAEEIVKVVGDKNTQIFFIDDRPDQIMPLKDFFPTSITFLLKRKEGRYNDKKTKAVDFEIKNLKEAKQIIKNKIEKQKS